MLSGLFSKACHAIQSVADTRAEQKGYYCYFHIAKVSETDIVEETGRRCARNAAGETVRCIQDTTRINPKDLERAANDLLSLNISCGHFDRFLEYLYRFGKAAHAFSNLLLRTIL